MIQIIPTSFSYNFRVLILKMHDKLKSNSNLQPSYEVNSVKSLIQFEQVQWKTYSVWARSASFLKFNSISVFISSHRISSVAYSGYE